MVMELDTMETIQRLPASLSLWTEEARRMRGGSKVSVGGLKFSIITSHLNFKENEERTTAGLMFSFSQKNNANKKHLQ